MFNNQVSVSVNMDFLDLVPGLHSKMADFHFAKERFLTPFQHPMATLKIVYETDRISTICQTLSYLYSCICGL